jgi:hypothetical protein
MFGDAVAMRTFDVMQEEMTKGFCFRIFPARSA